MTLIWGFRGGYSGRFWGPVDKIGVVGMEQGANSCLPFVGNQSLAHATYKKCDIILDDTC